MTGWHKYAFTYTAYFNVIFEALVPSTLICLTNNLVKSEKSCHIYLLFMTDDWIELSWAISMMKHSNYKAQTHTEIFSVLQCNPKRLHPPQPIDFNGCKFVWDCSYMLWCHNWCEPRRNVTASRWCFRIHPKVDLMQWYHFWILEV